MKLELKDSPIVFFDLEATGINIANDRIVELSMLKIKPNGAKESITEKVNPEIPIPEEISKIHGIHDEDVKDAKTFKELAPTLLLFLKNCDLGGYNSNRFDVPLLAEEFLRAGFDLGLEHRRLIDVQVIFHRMEQRTLEAAYKFYCGKVLENAHSAEADNIATYEVLEAQLGKYSNLKGDIGFLHEFSSHGTKKLDFAGRFVYNNDDIPVFNFGKHKGKSVSQVLTEEPGYYGWMMKGDFPLYTKKVLKELKNKL